MYTLVPGGGFMLCESIADIDENVPRPPMSEVDQKHAISALKDDDPVGEYISKLKEVYEEIVQPLMIMNYTPATAEDIVNATDTISRAVSKISEKTVKWVSKLQGLILVSMRVYGDHYCGDKFYAHVGHFIKNMKRIQQECLMEFSYNVDVLPMFNGEWRINRILSMASSNPEILDMLIDADMLTVLTGFDRDGMEVFDSLSDVLSFFFTNIERLVRMERHIEQTIYISRLLESMNSDMGQSPCAPCDMRYNGPDVLRFVSSVSRRTMQEMYEVQCDLVDGKMDVNLSKSITRVMNLYAIITLYVMYMAYQLRRHTAWASAVDRYTNQLLTVLGTN